MNSTCPSCEDILRSHHADTGTMYTHPSYLLVQLLDKYTECSGFESVVAWQTLSSYILSRWSREAKSEYTSFPVSFSEASWTGLFNPRTLEWDIRVLNELASVSTDAVTADRLRALHTLLGRTLPRLCDLEDLSPGEYRLSSYYTHLWDGQDRLFRGPCRLFLGMGDGAACCYGNITNCIADIPGEGSPPHPVPVSVTVSVAWACLCTC